MKIAKVSTIAFLLGVLYPHQIKAQLITNNGAKELLKAVEEVIPKPWGRVRPLTLIVLDKGFYEKHIAHFDVHETIVYNSHRETDIIYVENICVIVNHIGKRRVHHTWIHVYDEEILDPH